MMVLFEWVNSGNRTMLRGDHIGIPKWNRPNGRETDHPGAAPSAHANSPRTPAMSANPPALSSLPAILQALNDNPFGAVVLVTLAALSVVAYALKLTSR
jgi:hypothetical protein